MKKEEKIALIKPHTTQTHAEKKKQSKPSHNIEEEKTRNNLANFSNDPHSHIHRRKEKHHQQTNQATWAETNKWNGRIEWKEKQKPKVTTTTTNMRAYNVGANTASKRVEMWEKEEEEKNWKSQIT